MQEGLRVEDRRLHVGDHGVRGVGGEVEGRRADNVAWMSVGGAGKSGKCIPLMMGRFSAGECWTRKDLYGQLVGLDFYGGGTCLDNASY